MVITLISSDSIEFKVEYEASVVSKLLNEMIDDPDAENIIPLPNIDSIILEKIVVFMKYNLDNPLDDIEKPIKSNNMKENVPEWYYNFVDISDEQLVKLIMGANYMDISKLMELVCAKFASVIKSKENPTTLI